MKQTIYNFLILCLLLIPAINLRAQGVTCERNFVIKTVTTPSTCSANGQIAVTLVGNLTAIETSMTEYALRPITGTEGTSLQFTKNNVLQGVAAGTYVVSVRTFCIENVEVGVVTESTNVVVGGTYKPLMAEFDLSRMRKSYPDCPTGSIAFNVKVGTGYGALSFAIFNAPAGVALGAITPTKGSTVNGYIQYALPGLYPPGAYQIDVYDSCSQARMSFTLEQTTGLPNLLANGSYLYATNIGSCNTVSWTLSAPTSSEIDHYYKHFTAGLYEIAIVPASQTPVSSDWFVWTSSSKNITLPNSYKNYFSSGTLKAYLRLKDCDEYIYNTTTNIKAPSIRTNSYAYLCDGYTYATGLWTDYDGVWCYPITVELIDGDNQVVATEVLQTASTDLFLKTYICKYGTNYSVRLTDASNYVYTINRGKLDFNHSAYLGSITYGCTTFTSAINVSSLLSCYPVDVKVYKESSTGVFDLFETFSLTSYSKNIEYPYGKYRIDATFNYILPATGQKYTSTQTNTITSPRPTSFTVTSGTQSSASPDLSNEYYGYFYIYASQTFPIGTKFTVTSAPAGYPYVGRTLTATSSSSSFYMGSSTTLYTYNTNSTSSCYMPKGTYTITSDDGCGNILTTTVDLITGYDAKAVKYKVEPDGCNGALITLDGTGYVKLKETASSSYTNFKIISGPSGGYETALKNYNQSLRINADGQYVIGTVINSFYSSYYIRKDTINYVASKPTLKTSSTAAYVCTDPGSYKGYIIFTGQGGKAPYAYQLLDKDKKPIAGLTATGNADERVVFNHGAAGETYFVQITDACGNSTTQQVSLADLKTQSIIYSIPPTGEYCTGETLMLNCITLGQTTYRWEKKNSSGGYDLISTQQNPRISPITTANSGTYRVTVTPEYCGEPIVGELTIVVRPPLAAGTPSANQQICVATRAAAMSAPTTGGKGLITYQWQSSSDGNIFANITGATSATYTPPVFTSSGPHYYRVITSDDCQKITSSTITLNVKPCYIMVNPNIRTKAKK